MDKIEILQTAKTARIDEVQLYQINIDNYQMALKKLQNLNDPDLKEFQEQLNTLLHTEIVEQKKAKIMLEVVCDQLEEIK